MRIRVLGAVASVLAATLFVVPLTDSGSAEAAAATTTVVVRGTAFPAPLTAQLSLAGCASLSGVTPETPQPVIGKGPVPPPTGRRSLGYDLVGGNAAGALFVRSSMTGTTTADLQAYAAAGTTGVVYAGYQEPADSGTSRVWVGRADVTLAAGAWRRVSAIGLRFAWAKRDLTTGASLLAGPAALVDVASFARAHGGDGPGFYTVGLGCDGQPFSLDTFRVGVAGSTTVHDLEGLATRTAIAGTHDVAAGGTARLTGAVRDQSGARISGATLLLEQRTAADPTWTTVYRDAAQQVPVVVDAAAVDPAVEVTPSRTTSYRFRFVDRPLAEGSASAPFVVTVTPGLTARATDDRTVVGRMTPAVEGATVTLWRAGRSGGGALARARVDAAGRYALAVPAEVGGDLVVRLDAVDGLEPTESEPVRVEALVAAPPAEPPPAETPADDAGPAQQQDQQQDQQQGSADPTEQAPADEPSPEPPSEPAPESTPESTPEAPVKSPGETPTSPSAPASTAAVVPETATAP